MRKNENFSESFEKHTKIPNSCYYNNENLKVTNFCCYFDAFVLFFFALKIYQKAKRIKYIVLTVFCSKMTKCKVKKKEKLIYKLKYEVSKSVRSAKSDKSNSAFNGSISAYR